MEKSRPSPPPAISSPANPTNPTAATPSPLPPLKPKLGQVTASPSFRLRSPSLNNVRLRRVFDLFDRNSDGEITADELTGALHRLGLAADLADLAPLAASHVRQGRSGLDFDDFQSLHRALGDVLFGPDDGGESAAEAAEMAEAFRVFDEDDDGFISAAELQAVLGKLGMKEGESIEGVRKMICSVDQNRDGRVDFGEFRTMMQGIAVNGS